jgi:hypothetical protein
MHYVFCNDPTSSKEPGEHLLEIPKPLAFVKFLYKVINRFVEVGEDQSERRKHHMRSEIKALYRCNPVTDGNAATLKCARAGFCELCDNPTNPYSRKLFRCAGERAGLWEARKLGK